MANNGKRMYALLEAQELLDMVFIIGPEKVRIPAHQVVLRAASEVFKTKISDCWKSRENPEIVLPTNSVEAVQVFIKGIYLDEVDPETSMDILQEIILLSHEFMVDHLLEICLDTILSSKRVTVDNCLFLLELGNLKEISYVLWEVASSCFLQNLGYFLGELVDLIYEARINIPYPDIRKTVPTCWEEIKEGCVLLSNPTEVPYTSCPSSSRHWSAGTWISVLGLEESPYIREIREETLFEQLQIWRAVDSSREEAFARSLLPLIRFPLMDLKYIYNEVLPTKLLTDKDVTDLACYHYGVAEKNLRNFAFSCKARFVFENATQPDKPFVRLRRLSLASFQPSKIIF